MAKATCKNCLHDGVCFMQEVCEDLEDQLAVFGCKDFAETAPVRAGRWETRKVIDGFPAQYHHFHNDHNCKYGYGDYNCVGHPYCPNCGAKMDGEADD